LILKIPQASFIMTQPSHQTPSAKITYSASSSQPILDALNAVHTRLNDTLEVVEGWHGTTSDCATVTQEIAEQARHLDVAFDNAAALAPDFFAGLKTKGRLEDTDPDTSSHPSTARIPGSDPALTGPEQVVYGLKELRAAVLHASVETETAKTNLVTEGQSADDAKSRLRQVLRAERQKVKDAVAQLVTAVWASGDLGARD
jgi:hypothetical protein